MTAKIKQKGSRTLRSAAQLVAAVVMVVASFPMVASAAPQLPNREARVTTTKAGATFNITLEFDTTTLASSTTVQGIEVEFCDQPLGPCTTLNTPTIPASSTVSQSGWLGATAFGTYTREATSDNGGSNNQIKVSRIDAADERTRSNATIGFTGLTNNAGLNKSYFPRIRLYSDAATTSLVWEGAVAQSTTQQLTINARVQEILQFCVGTTLANAGTAECSDISGSTVDLGVIDSSTVSISPVSTNGGNNTNGLAMLRTNAVNGAVIDYFSEQETASGALKVAGATCAGDGTVATGSKTDQCFNSAGTAQTIFGGTDEGFGMTVSSIDAANGTTTNLLRDLAYDGDGTNTDGWAWDATGTADRIASSAGSSVKVVDDEVLVMRFAAKAAATTPTGQYGVVATYIATATY